jgi:hypothetical protein
MRIRIRIPNTDSYNWLTHFFAEGAAAAFDLDHVREGTVHQAYLAQHIVLNISNMIHKKTYKKTIQRTAH